VPYVNIVKQPKYWCKDCKVFVRDTKFEKTQHEATGRHQSNIRRAINNLHRNVQREEREKQRTKDEVDRLNRLVSGVANSSASTSSDQNAQKKPTFTKPQTVTATAEERKRQMAQLAALGVQVPEGFRKENAMVGEWETVNITPIYDGSERLRSKEEDDSEDDQKNRKRNLGNEEDDLGSEERPAKKAWKPALKTYEYKRRSHEDDVEALLGDIKTARPSIKPDPAEIEEDGEAAEEDSLLIKEEESTEDGMHQRDHPKDLSNIPNVKIEAAVEEEVPPTAGIVFKKRRAKPKS
jgi:hypothetical protein